MKRNRSYPTNLKRRVVYSVEYACPEDGRYDWRPWGTADTLDEARLKSADLIKHMASGHDVRIVKETTTYKVVR